MEPIVNAATNQSMTSSHPSRATPKARAASTAPASPIWTSVLALDTSRPNFHGLVKNPRDNDRAHDHQVARHHENGDRRGQHPIDRERHVDRHEQRPVGQRIEIRAKFAAQIEALGDEAIDGVG